MTNKKNLVLPGIIGGLAVVAIHKNRGLAFVFTLVLMVIINDTLIHHLVKPLIGRTRPCHTIEILRYVTNCGSSFSFPSNHAMNMFSVATFTSLCFRNKIVLVLAFTIAVIVAFSRVYLGQHYPTDVIGGALWGSVVGYLAYKLNPKILQSLNTWEKIEKWTNQTKTS